MAEAVIESLMKNTAKEVTWLNLKKYKIPFVTRNVLMLND